MFEAYLEVLSRATLRPGSVLNGIITCCEKSRCVKPNLRVSTDVELKLPPEYFGSGVLTLSGDGPLSNSQLYRCAVRFGANPEEGTLKILDAQLEKLVAMQADLKPRNWNAWARHRADLELSVFRQSDARTGIGFSRCLFSAQPARDGRRVVCQSCHRSTG